MSYSVTFYFPTLTVTMDEGYDEDERLFYIDYDLLEGHEFDEAERIVVNSVCDHCEEEYVHDVKVDKHYIDLAEVFDVLKKEEWIEEDGELLCERCK
jgi:hypothetical protein